MNAKERKRLVRAVDTYLPLEYREPIFRALSLLAAIEDPSGPTPETYAAFAGYADAENRTAFMAEACNKMGKIEQERNAALRALDQMREGAK